MIFIAYFFNVLLFFKIPTLFILVLLDQLIVTPYDVSTTIKIDGKEVDTVKTKTGFRKTDFSNGLFKLNDRTLHLKGYAQRTSNEWVALGASVPAWLSDYSNGLMVESNANLVRWMHVTPWKQDVESCDRVGLIQAMPAGDA